MSRPFRLVIITGEASGDALAQRFLVALRQRLGDRPLELAGVGGQALIDQGLKPFFPQADIAVMGFGPVIARLPLLLRRMNDAAKGAAEFKPDLLLTVDAPDFTLRVAQKLRKQAPSIPIVHWVCPTVWAWRSGRARRMVPHVDRILALLPFEPAALERLHGPKTVYVGHPVIERLGDLRPDADEAARRADTAAPDILVLPGSRRSEINHLLPVFGEAVAQIAKAVPGARFLLPAVTHLRGLIAEKAAAWPVAPQLIDGEAAKYAAFRSARAAIAASGTVTLELALAQVPTVAAYRGADWEAAIARRLIKLPTVILANLVAGRNVVPEFIQQDLTAEALARELLAILADGPAREAQLAGFREIETNMRSAGASPAANAVDATLALLAETTGNSAGG